MNRRYKRVGRLIELTDGNKRISQKGKKAPLIEFAIYLSTNFCFNIKELQEYLLRLRQIKRSGFINSKKVK